MKLPIIKTIVSNENLTDIDLDSTIKVLVTITQARGLSEEELDIIGELISNIEGAKIVRYDYRHYGTSLKDALNKFMQRVIKTIQ